jgi:hypothetical protein
MEKSVSFPSSLQALPPVVDVPSDVLTQAGWSAVSLSAAGSAAPSGSSLSTVAGLTWLRAGVRDRVSH